MESIPSKDLSASDPVGTRGQYKGREAVRVDLDGRKYVIATRNEGAESETDYGEYYKFDEAVKHFSAGMEGYSASGVWRLPTEDELWSLTGLANSWATRSGVEGMSFPMASGMVLFFPAAGIVCGFVDYCLRFFGGTGYYWSSMTCDMHYAYNFGFYNDFRYVYKSKKTFGLSVRLFCALPQE